MTQKGSQITGETFSNEDEHLRGVVFVNQASVLMPPILVWGNTSLVVGLKVIQLFK